MKKMDLHIHTIKSISDADFEFDVDVLEKYVQESKLDIIGITNHNLFDDSNFDNICSKLTVKILPGVEIDIEGSHLLVFSPIEKLKLFIKQCKILKSIITTPNDEIDFEKFKNIFTNYEDYLIIPHYENKKPSISYGLLQKFGKNITAGEVSNPKRWNKCKKNEENLVPVIFSDIRIKKDLKVFPNTGTFIDIDDINFNNIKLALSNKDKVFLDETKAEDEFVVHGNVNASTKLNLVVGRRSSGKTHLLNSIEKSFPDSEIKYVSQFSIVNRAEEKEFSRLLNTECFESTQTYLKELGSLMQKYKNIDLLKNKETISNYINTLKKYAEEKDLEDVYSSTALFSEDSFSNLELNSVSDLIKALKTLLDNIEYKSLIEKQIRRDNMIKLLKSLILEMKDQKISIKAKTISNEIIKVIKEKLDLGSSRTQVTEADFGLIAKDIARVMYFNKILDNLLIEGSLKSLEINPGRFKRKVTKRKYTSANDVKTYNKMGQVSIKDPFDNSYVKKDYFGYLIELKNIDDSLVKPEHLICLEYSLQNERGVEVSGGERAEYLLSNEISQASKFDFLLIDEPEASFDNIFLNESIRKMIRDISTNTTTFVTTHNSSLGAEMLPNKILYTEYKDDEYTVYSGKFGAEDLVNKNGDTIPCSKVVYDTLESGKTNYKKRSDIYENLEN